jgi:RNA polymerase sigma-70 factor, ECF subfamily
VSALDARSTWLSAPANGEAAAVPGDPDESLLAEGRAGNRSALERLLAPHAPGLYRLCHGILRNSHETEDAVQETFLRALRALPRFRGEASFRSWLFRIALNLCLERRRKSRPSVPWDEDLPLTTPGAEQPAERVLQSVRVAQALAELHPRHRAILLLKEQEGWTVSEIAAAFRCSERRVYHELRMAHKTLARWRERQDEGD